MTSIERLLESSEEETKQIYQELEEIVKIKVSEEFIDNTNYIRIEFVDNGIGISDEKKQLVFERGNRELKGSKGMGLGLSIVKKILNSYQGKIWVENRVKDDFSKGTNVVLLLQEVI